MIQAFNEEMPFEQFVIEQLAGDLLPNATVSQKIATGFHRTVTCNVEAGVHPEENRVNQIVDRVNTTGTVFLGTSLDCCQCHNHKYDPFTQKDYYQLFAYFNNTPLEVKLNSGVQYNFYGPTMDLPLSPKDQQKKNDLERELADVTEQQKTLQKKLHSDQKRWEEQLKASLQKSNSDADRWQPLEFISFNSTGKETYQKLKDDSILIGGTVPGRTIYRVQMKTSLTNLNAFRIDALTDDSLPGKGPGRGDAQRPNFILSEFEVYVLSGEKLDQRKKIALHSANADYSQKRWEVTQAIDGDLSKGWAIGQQFAKPHWATFRTAKPIGSRKESTALEFVLTQNYGSGRTIGRFRLSAFNGDPASLALPDEIAKLIRKKKRSAKEEQKLSDYYLKQNSEYVQLEQRKTGLQKELQSVKPATTLVMVEMDQPRKTNIMLRGNYLSPGPAVTYGTPQTMHSLDAKSPKNRLGLAKWIVHAENPLLRRVTVNRWWAEFFGQGIVATLEDFGTQGELPTHPELLDWLAVELLENGGSMKKLHKMIVMSATFQQSSRVSESLLERDPANKLYARGPRFRMSAEMIRDNALQISGLLVEKQGGPPVMPYQPNNIWRAVGRNAPKWREASNEDRFRRGIYVIWRRAAPYPSFVNFDAPDRGSCVVKRPRTNTPLQALTLLNDQSYIEMGLSLASQILQQNELKTLEERMTYAFQRTLARRPNAEELKILTGYYQKEYDRLKRDPSEVESLISNVRGFTLPKSIDSHELSAWFFVANVLLNLDETITNG